jgi:diaminopimelate epimerase
MSPRPTVLGFEKYHGIGNDFLVVELADASALQPSDAVALCDRHFGVGGDGVLIVSPAEGARARMTVLNADGSRPEMCGNGLRCVALYLARKDGHASSEFAVLTDAGPRLCHVETAPSGAEGSVRTSMGRGVLGADFSFTDEGESFRLHRVSMGNPHAVCFREPISDSRLDRVGSTISAQEPGGTNVEVVTVEGPRDLRVAVWERGVGRTLACGTGAVGTVVVAASLGKVPFGEPVRVQLPGGVVTVTVEPSLETSFEGPAEFVFRGETRLPTPPKNSPTRLES